MDHTALQSKLREAQALARNQNSPAACLILRQLLEQDADAKVRVAAAIGLILLNSYVDFRAAATVLKPSIQGSRDQQLLSAYCYAAFALGDHADGVRAARAAIAGDPQNWQAMRMLGMAHLLGNSPVDAFLAFAAAAGLTGDAGIVQQKELAACLMRGENVRSFVFDGDNYRFLLQTETSQMIEAAVTHLHGALTEPQELCAIGQHVGPCRTIVEVGTCVGNHLVYFLKKLRARQAIVLDYDPRCIAAARRNVELNAPYAAEPEIHFHQIGVSRSRGQASGPSGYPVDVVPLDEACQSVRDIDFIKIDVDGLELEALAGAKGLIAKHKPSIMVEVARENRAGFTAFLDEIAYRVLGSVDRGSYENVLIAAS